MWTDGTEIRASKNANTSSTNFWDHNPTKKLPQIPIIFGCHKEWFKVLLFFGLLVLGGGE